MAEYVGGISTMYMTLHHRLIASESVTRHTLFREETRWPGYSPVYHIID